MIDRSGDGAIGSTELCAWLDPQASGAADQEPQATYKAVPGRKQLPTASSPKRRGNKPLWAPRQPTPPPPPLKQSICGRVLDPRTHVCKGAGTLHLRSTLSIPGVRSHRLGPPLAWAETAWGRRWASALDKPRPASDPPDGRPHSPDILPDSSRPRIPNSRPNSPDSLPHPPRSPSRSRPHSPDSVASTLYGQPRRPQNRLTSSPFNSSSGLTFVKVDYEYMRAQRDFGTASLTTGGVLSPTHRRAPQGPVLVWPSSPGPHNERDERAVALAAADALSGRTFPSACSHGVQVDYFPPHSPYASNSSSDASKALSPRLPTGPRPQRPNPSPPWRRVHTRTRPERPTPSPGSIERPTDLLGRVVKVGVSFF